MEEPPTKAEDYKALLRNPLYGGARITLGTFLYKMLKEKIDTNQSNNGFDRNIAD